MVAPTINNVSVSIVIPFYNEEEYIPVTLKVIDQTLNGSLDYEIILVDDGSTDESAKIAASLSQKYNKIRLVTSLKNEGLGSALRSGFSCASKDYILYTDMDLPFDFMNDFWRIYATAKNYDLCYGQRINKNKSIKRRMYSKVFNMIIGLFFN